MATDIIFPEWKIWTQFLRQTADGLRMDAMEQSHPIEVSECSRIFWLVGTHHLHVKLYSLLANAVIKQW